MVVLPSSLEDSRKSPAGIYRIVTVSACGSIMAFFLALVIAYVWRSHTPPFWDPIKLPSTLWLSTVIILISSGTFETGRRKYRRGGHRAATYFFIATTILGLAFLGSQFSAWLELVKEGAYLAQNPHSSFFYLFTGLHAAHLVGGLVCLAVVLLRKSPRREMVDAMTLYWHFLGVLWIALFSTLHLVS